MYMSQQNTVLIVDDDAEIRELIAMYLQDQQIRTIQAGDGPAAIRIFRKHHPDLVLLDIILPGMDGYAVFQEIRREAEIPVVFLTSKWEPQDIVEGLELGGDDYITKPFLPDVLVARVKSHLRRLQPENPGDVIRFGDLEIHRDIYEVRYRGRDLPFLAKEIRLFIFLAEHPKHVFSAEQLYEKVWDFSEGDPRTVMVHISNIRKKLELYAPDTVRIETIKGMGYRLVPLSRSLPGNDKPSLREAILDAASEVFAERGYSGLTVREIARRLGIPTSVVYSLFHNKEELFLHIYRSLIDTHLSMTEGKLQASDRKTVREKLDELLRSIIRFQLSEETKTKMFIRILLFPEGYFEQNLKSEFRKFEREEREIFSALFRSGMESGEIRQQDEHELTNLLICILDGLFWEMQRYTEQEFLEHFESVWKQFWRLIEA